MWSASLGEWFQTLRTTLMSSFHDWSWRWRHYDLSKRPKLCAHWHSVTFQKTRIWGVNNSLWGRYADCQQEAWNLVHVHRSLLKQPGTEQMVCIRDVEEPGSNPCRTIRYPHRSRVSFTFSWRAHIFKPVKTVFKIHDSRPLGSLISYTLNSLWQQLSNPCENVHGTDLNYRIQASVKFSHCRSRRIQELRSSLFTVGHVEFRSCRQV